MADKPGRVKQVAQKAAEAAKQSATNLPAMTACVCFTVVMCFEASNLKDGSEARTAFYAALGTFFALFLGYVFTGKK